MDQRDRLIDAAIHCLQQRGYARTTTRDIVAAAGAHLPAVNYYFGSKEDLLKTAVARALRRWTESVMAATDGGAGTPSDDLRGSIGAFLDSLEDNRDFVVAGVEAYAQAPRSAEVRELMAEELRRAREVTAARIAATARAGGVTGDGGEAAGTDGPGHAGEDGGAHGVDDDIRGVASVLLALFDGLALQWLLAPDQVPEADDVVRALRVLGAVAEGREPARESP